MIAIVGGGCSGLLVAANLRRFAPDVSYRVYESGPVGGHAYARAEPYHLLNVRAGRMSAWADRPEDFVRWSHSTTSPLEPDQFAPRVRYGKYLRSLVDPSCLVRTHVESVDELDAKHVVLALGHRESDGAGHPAWQQLPPGVMAEPQVVVLGTGLTAVDVVLALDARGYQGRVFAVSRHGLLPRAHPTAVVADRPPPDSLLQAPSLRALVREVRRHLGADEAPGAWQSKVDGLRPHVQKLWAALSPVERERYLRHWSTRWEVHRHRLAPQLQTIIERWLGSGQLVVQAGQLLDWSPRSATFRPRGHADARTLDGFVVNALGPGRARHPLVEQLVGTGEATLGPLGLGVRADRHGALVGPAGRQSARWFTLGPLRRGELWETTAVGEIREQAQALAAHLAERERHSTR